MAPRWSDQSSASGGKRAHSRAAVTAAATSSTSASVSVRQSSRSRPSRTTPDDRRVADPQRPGQVLFDGAGEARQLGERKRSAAGAADRLLDLAAHERGEPLCPRPHRGCILSEHAQNRDLACRPLGVEVQAERAFERGKRELVGAERALQRMAAQTFDQVGPADDDARLWAAQQLVAREAGEVGSGREAVAGGGLVLEREEGTGTEVVHEREGVPLRDGGELLSRPAAR